MAPEPVVALLRAVNVGGRNAVPMAGLRALFAELGYPGARTYVQSGNVLFRAEVGRAAARAALATALAAAIQERFGVDQPVILRTAPELARLGARNPFLAAQADHSRVHVMFLADDPTPAGLAKMAKHTAPPDEFLLDGRDVFVHYPDGAGRTKLRLDFGVPGTARNWRTVTTLQAMVAEPAP